MNIVSVFRLILLISVILIGIIRAYFQRKISRDTSKFSFQEDAVSLIFGGTAAIVNIVFGVEYIRGGLSGVLRRNRAVFWAYFLAYAKSTKEAIQCPITTAE